jgi:hypothetical protein
MLKQSMIGLVGACSLCAAAAAQSPLFSNASGSPGTPALGTVAATVNGASAPAGAMWSELGAIGSSESNASAGVACQTDSAGGVRVTDNFVVPPGQSWTLDQAWVYVYAPDHAGTGSPVTSGTLRIWYGAPGAGGQVVWGDTLTNRYASAQALDVYRVFATGVGPVVTMPTPSRRVFRVALSAPTTLGPGEYWLDWQLTTAQADGSVFAVPATMPGSRSQAGWNASQFVEGAWGPVLDPGKPVTASDVALDMAFIVTGTIGTSCDSVDFNQDTILPDVTDIADFLAVFAGGVCAGQAPTDPPCNTDIDFNNDGLFPDTQDITSLLSVFAGGECL